METINNGLVSSILYNLVDVFIGILKVVGRSANKRKCSRFKSLGALCVTVSDRTASLLFCVFSFSVKNADTKCKSRTQKIIFWDTYVEII